MKIERLNDNQIRCILDKEDFDQRQLRISELAYGSEKAKELFRDMMEQAAMEFGFETEDNIPLMIEAVPVSTECLILVVTKVEDPEELDTRFSRFSSSGEDMEEEDMPMDLESIFGGAPGGPDGIADIMEEDDIISFGDDDSIHSMEDSTENENILAPFNQAIKQAKEDVIKKKNLNAKRKPLTDQIYVFESLDSVIEASGPICGFYHGDSILYKDTDENAYYMILTRQDTEEDLFIRACNICAEHGEVIPACYATPNYFKEHFQLICGEYAVQTLAQLS